MTLKLLALAFAMASSLAPATALAQTAQTNLVAPQLAAPRPEGHASNTTDRVGLTNRPAITVKRPTPQHVPGWHIPLPHIHRGR
jgi:hypothetical protein